MLSKNNNRELQRKIDDRQDRFTLRKLSIGVASVLLGSFIMGTQLSQTAYASNDNSTAITETTPQASLPGSNDASKQSSAVESTSAPVSASSNQNNQVRTASEEVTATSNNSSSINSSSAAKTATASSQSSQTSAALTNNNPSSTPVMAAATQTPTPAPANGYSVTMPTPSYATGYNESNVPLDPNTAHQTVQSFIVMSPISNPGENAQKGLNNLYAYSVSQADVNGTGIPSKIYFMKFNSDDTLVKTVTIPTDATGGTIYKIDDYTQVTVSRFQNQPASFQLGKVTPDTNRFMPIYNAFTNQVGEGAFGSTLALNVPTWTTQTTTYKDENGNEMRPSYTQYGWTMDDFTTEPVQIPGYDVRATPDYVAGQYDANIPTSQKNGQITLATAYKQGEEIDTVRTFSKGTQYVQAKIIDNKGTVEIRAWATYAKSAGTFDPNSSNPNDNGRTAAVLPPADYDFETNPDGYKIYNNSDMVVGGGQVGNEQQAARNKAGYNGAVAFQQIRFVYTDPANQTPPAIGNNASNNAPIDTISYPPYPAGSVRYADAQDYVILPYGTFTWGGYDTANSLTITNPVVFPSNVNYVYWTQTATITYIDDTTGKVLHTDNINGQIDSTSKYSPNSDQYSGSSTIGYDNPRTTKTIGDYEKEGYVLVSNNFPTNGVVLNTPNTPQSYQIHFVEGAQEITPNTPADQVPTGTPDDAQPSALSKDVTLKVNYVNSDGTKFTGTIPSNADQSVNFTGTAYVSKVTGQLVNTKEENGQLVVDSSNTNTPKITWTPSTGSFNEVVSPVESGYYLKNISSNQNGNNVGPIIGLTHNSNDMTVTVTYAPLGHIIPVGPDGTPIPGADQPQFPNNPDNPAEGNPGNKPDVPNWTPTEPGTTVSPNPNDPGANVNVPYTQDQGSITVTVHDVTDNVNLPQYGKTSGEENVGTTFTYDKNTVIQELENKGYKVLNPDVVIPTTISKGAQNIVINVEHEIVPVTPENPGTPGQPINPNDPDGPKWPDGTAKDDLEATGTQTIHYEGAGDKTPADNTQHFTFTKSATVDKVTGKIVSETGWNVASHTFGNVDTPVVAGYHADKAVAGGATITPNDLNKTIVVTYAPNGHVIPVGPDGNPIPGADQPQFPTNPDNPSETTPGQVPDVPGYHPETGKPGDPVDPVPGQPGENVPVKYVPNTPTPETYTGSQTIKFVDGTTGKEIETPNVQTAPDLTGDHTFGKINTPVIKGYTTTQTTAGGATVTKNNPNATITVTYTPNGHIIPVGPDGNPIPGADQPQFPTNPDNPSETTPGQVPDVPGYHPETGKPGEPVNPVPGKPGEDVPVKYVPDTPVEQGSITVTVRDTTDNVDLPQYGKSSGEENVGTTFTYDKNTVIQELENKGYKVLNPDVVIPTTISKGAQNIVINVEHELVPVTPENPGQPGQPINPNDPNGPKWPDGTVKNDLEATGTQTIHYIGAGDQTPANNVQHFTFTKSAVVDKVTGKIVSETGWNVASHTFGNIDTPVVPGYHADKAVAGGTTITPDDLNKTVTVTYTPNGHIIPVGPDGKPLPNVPQPQYPTNPNNPTEVTPNEPVPEIPGYTPNVSTVTPENPGENTPVVYTPNEKPVEPTTPSENGTPNGNTGNPTTPQPETPAKPMTPTTTPAGNGNIPTNGQTTSPAGGSVTTSNVNNANATTPVAQKQAAQLPQTGNEQLKHEGILGLLALGVAGLLAFGKKRRKE